MLTRAHPGERHGSGKAPAVKVRHKAARGGQEGRLAGPRQARQQAKLALRQLQPHVFERGLLDPRIAVADVVKAQDRRAHGSIPLRSQNGKSAARISARHSAPVPALTGMWMLGYALNAATEDPDAVLASTIAIVATAEAANAMSCRDHCRERR